MRFYNVNGAVVPAGEAALGVGDLSILRGYGIFDYFLVRDGHPLFFDDYLNRFLRSAQLMHLDPLPGRAELAGRIRELISLNEMKAGAIRLVMTGGYATDGYTPATPNLLVLAHPFRRPPADYYEKGIKLITHQYLRDVPEVKTINYLTGIRLIPDLKRAGALEPLYHDGQHLRESVRSNFFLVMPDDTIVTPGRDILFGITRKQLLAAAAPHFRIEEREVALDELRQAREAFITGSNKAVMPVVRIDDQVYGDGLPGPVTRRLMELFEGRSAQYVRQEMVDG